MKDGKYTVLAEFEGYDGIQIKRLQMDVANGMLSLKYPISKQDDSIDFISIELEYTILEKCNSNGIDFKTNSTIIDPRLTYRKGENPLSNLKPIISTKIPNGRVVAVGNEMVILKPNQTFSDFLHDYFMLLMGKGWLNEQRQICEFHLMSPVTYLLKKYDAEVLAIRGNKKTKVIIPHTGAVGAILNLGNDLYTLKHNSDLQKNLIERLKSRHLFQGAFYEISVCATIVRAGFKIDYEDESDRTKKHPEFIATHKKTNQRIAVEAKSRNNDKLFCGFENEDPNKPFRIGRILNSAFLKKPYFPLIIFLELNLPANFLGENPNDIPDWMKQSVSRILPPPTKNNPDPFNMLVITNRPFFYTIKKPHEFRESNWRIISKYPKHSIRFNDAWLDISNAVDSLGVMHGDFSGRTIKKYDKEVFKGVFQNI